MLISMSMSGGPLLLVMHSMLLIPHGISIVPVGMRETLMVNIYSELNLALVSDSRDLSRHFSNPRLRTGVVF